MASSFAAELIEALENSWLALARPNQLPPPGDWWQIWLLLAGRGFGKTRTLAEWVCKQVALGQASRIALVAATVPMRAMCWSKEKVVSWRSRRHGFGRSTNHRSGG